LTHRQKHCRFCALLASSPLVGGLSPGLDRSTEQNEPAQPFKLDQRLKPEIVAEIVARYESGEPSTAVAASHGISKASVIRLLREAGVSIRNQGLSDDQIAEAAQHYASGLSLAKIGARFGVDHGTVWRALKKRGVKMRDTHGREVDSVSPRGEH
jgi:transposase-like protein